MDCRNSSASALLSTQSKIPKLVVRARNCGRGRRGSGEKEEEGEEEGE